MTAEERAELRDYRAQTVESAIFWRAAVCCAKSDPHAAYARVQLARMDNRLDEIDAELRGD